jgi:hypothetical protein
MLSTLGTTEEANVVRLWQQKKLKGYYSDPIVYCFKITNTGSSYLGSIVIINPELNIFDDTSVGKLAPGDSVTIPVQKIIEGNLLNHVSVKGNPSNRGRTPHCWGLRNNCYRYFGSD